MSRPPVLAKDTKSTSSASGAQRVSPRVEQRTGAVLYRSIPRRTPAGVSACWFTRLAGAERPRGSRRTLREHFDRPPRAPRLRQSLSAPHRSAERKLDAVRLANLRANSTASPRPRPMRSPPMTAILFTPFSYSVSSGNFRLYHTPLTSAARRRTRHAQYGPSREGAPSRRRPNRIFVAGAAAQPSRSAAVRFRARLQSLSTLMPRRSALDVHAAASVPAKPLEIDSAAAAACRRSPPRSLPGRRLATKCSSMTCISVTSPPSRHLERGAHRFSDGPRSLDEQSVLQHTFAKHYTAAARRAPRRAARLALQRSSSAGACRTVSPTPVGSADRSVDLSCSVCQYPRPFIESWISNRGPPRRNGSDRLRKLLAAGKYWPWPIELAVPDDFGHQLAVASRGGRFCSRSCRARHAPRAEFALPGFAHVSAAA